MRSHLSASFAVLFALALPACAAGVTADATPAVGDQDLVSTYEREGTILELTGRPLPSGLFDIAFYVRGPLGTRSVELDPETSGDEIVPELRAVVDAIGPQMVAQVRSTLSVSAPPTNETEARWLWMQQTIFHAPDGQVSRAYDEGCFFGLCDWYEGGCCCFNHRQLCTFLSD